MREGNDDAFVAFGRLSFLSCLVLFYFRYTSQLLFFSREALVYKTYFCSIAELVCAIRRPMVITVFAFAYFLLSFRSSLFAFRAMNAVNNTRNIQWSFVVLSICRTNVQKTTLRVHSRLSVFPYITEMVINGFWKRMTHYWKTHNILVPCMTTSCSWSNKILWYLMRLLFKTFMCLDFVSTDYLTAIKTNCMYRLI